MLPQSAARGWSARSNPLSASQAERLNSVRSTSLLTWCVTMKCLLLYLYQATLIDQQCLQDVYNANYCLRCLQVDVRHKRCQAPGCRKGPSFGFPGGQAQFCLEHKSADMVCHRCPCLLIYCVWAALCDRQCLQHGVSATLFWGAWQVDVVSPRCQGPGCMKLASFGFPGGRKEFCLEHKSADMVSYQCPCLLICFVCAALCDQQCLQDCVHCDSPLRCLQVDVQAKPCQEPGCKKQASCGFPGGKTQFCAEHKSADMVCHRCSCLLIHFVQAALCDQQCLQDGVHCNFVPRCLQVDVYSKRCQEPGCKKQAYFGFPGDKRQFCLEHKSADMVCYQYVCLLFTLYKQRCVTSSACKMVYAATLFWGACRWMFIPSAAKSQGARSDPLSASQAEKLNSVWRTSPLKWCVTCVRAC